MTTDRELLELAAKAIGFDLHVNFVGATQLLKGGQYVCFWKPLDDDGDALRLAVALRLTISCDRYNDDDYMVATPPHTHQGYDCLVDQDPVIATRRAIVRAAAAIGKFMSEVANG